MTLGELIKAARQRRGWTQDDLAKRLGVERSYVSQWETGTRKWPQEHIRAIAENLGLSQIKMAIAAGIIDDPDEARAPATDDPSPGYEALMYVAEQMEEREREALARIGTDLIKLRPTESVATIEPERVPALA